MSCSDDLNDDAPVENSNKELREGEYTDLENNVLTLLNEYRISQDIRPLKKAEVISNLSMGHTEYMIDSDQLSHDNFSDRHNELVSKINAKLVGENVAYGYNSAKGVVDGWLASSAHRYIIETEKYTHFGISIRADEKGRNYFTNIFINR